MAWAADDLRVRLRRRLGARHRVRGRATRQTFCEVPVNAYHRFQTPRPAATATAALPVTAGEERGRTTFVIAHRLSTIRSADQILVLEQGEIVERGNHQELLLKGGRYRQLYEKQYQFERDQFINPGEDFTPEPELVVPPPAYQEHSRNDLPA
jgi:hypothetical protein